MNAEEFWAQGIELLQQTKHWSDEDILDMNGTIVCDFADAYAAHVRDETLEEAAKVAEGLVGDVISAHSIRALKEKP